MGNAVTEPLGPEDPGEIGQFTILGLLGAGGMGEVYLGTCDGRYVAVKRVRSRLVSIERFNREVAILHRLPFGIAPAMLASDSTTSEPWFATEYVPGLTVDEAVRAFGPLTAEALWLLLAETAAPLQALHELGIVHRDLKPANIMLVRDGVKLIDFGIALAADQARLTRAGASSGTRGFVAPEQDAGSRDAAAPADVYSLGATLVYAASMVAPDAFPDLERLRAVDARLADIAESCLSADPEFRPGAADLAASARRRIGESSPSWPPAVMEQIAARRSFASAPVEKMATVMPTESGPTEPRPDRPSGIWWRRFAIPAAGVAALCGVGAIVLASLPGARPNTVLSESPSTHPSTNQSTTPPKPVPSPTFSPIPGINGGDDRPRVKGSEVDAASVAGDAGCSAWLDTDGSGDLAVVLNTALTQSCVAQLFRSDGMVYTISKSEGAVKTNFITDTGYTMWICIWQSDEQANTQCSPHFEMNGNTPVTKSVP